MKKRSFKLTAKDILHNTAMYDVYHEEYGMEDGWRDGDKKYIYPFMLRFPEITGIPISGTTCLDVGCGIGDLSVPLRQRGARDYLGIDLYGPSIEKAKEKYPQEKFIEGDFLAVPLRRKFDYVFSGGALTVKLPELSNYDFLRAALTKMWKHSKIGVAFSVLTDEDTLRDPGLFYFSRQRVEEICHEIAPEATVITEKTPGIFHINVFMYREALQV